MEDVAIISISGGDQSLSLSLCILIKLEEFEIYSLAILPL